MSTDEFGRLLRAVENAILEGMLYAIGTHIDFKEPLQEAPKERLYDVGTRLIFVSWIPSLTKLQVAV